MQIFGLQISRAKPEEKALNHPDNRGGWWPLVRESFTGAWQRNIVLTADQAMAFHAVFACHTLICSDIAKLRVKLVSETGGVWQEVKNPAYSPVLRKPNHFQNRIQFFENWVNSKLARGNTYVLLKRDGRRVVTGMYVLNPDRVQPLVSDDGQVFYRLDTDNLAAIEETQVIVPARDMIHDRFNCLFHPLVGISPLYASALAATQGTNIQNASSTLAANGIRPSALITYPARVPAEDAVRIKETWETQYGGSSGASKLAILGDGAKFEPLTMTSDEAQLIEQLKYTAEVVCSTYHVPPYKIGIGQQPTYNNVQALNVEYYSQCLQVLIESIEVCLDEGLATGEILGTEFDTDNLLRMDSVTQMDVLEKGRNYFSPDEGRARLSLPPTPGGKSVYRQQQDFSLEALAKRDAMEDPFGTTKPEPPAPPKPANDDEEQREAAQARSALLALKVREKLNARP
jgi:HK97 family phage portal protein